MLSSVSKACPFMFLVIIVSKWRGRSIDGQLLDLALMTNYSQSSFTWTATNSFSVLTQIQYCPGWSSNSIPAICSREYSR